MGDEKKHKVKHIVDQAKITNVLLGVAVIILLLNSFQLSDLGRSIEGIETTPSAGTGEQAVPSAGTAPPTAPAPSQRVEVELKADDHVKGSPDAPVTMYEYSDFQCPYCGRFYTQTLGQIESEYIDTGKVKLVYRHFPLSFHPYAQKAAEASECAAEQGKFWEMHDKLFGEGVEGGTATFKRYAADLGLDTETFGSCLDSGKYASEISAEMAEGSQLGITGTPGFFVNGQKVVGAQPFAAFQAAIDSELA